jgi:2-phosphosulfolactate phosphatase
MILLTTSGTPLICGAQASQAMYVASLRNYRAQIAHLITYHPRVAIIGAGSRAEFREEDELCCAWIADGLLAAGYEPENTKTVASIEKWRGAPLRAITDGASARYLQNTDQSRDLEYILSHIDDLNAVYRYEYGQVVKHAEELLLV